MQPWSRQADRLRVQLAGVQYVLDTTTQALALNKDRPFIYGEIVSFLRVQARQASMAMAAEIQHEQRCRHSWCGGGASSQTL